ncbi:MAG: peptidoglycan-associated lipoprotein [Pseudomonadota bacterium]|nr:peptidoglycan-associated lipoprotein [Pseudomonadota bacterium]
MLQVFGMLENKFKKLLAVAIIGAAIVACSSTKPPEQAPAAEPTPAPAPVIASAPVVASAPVATVSNHNSVYFAFDKYDIRDDYNGLIKSNSDYLAASAPAKVQVQGNTDDIGSVEYNLALGQRRADAVKKALIADGASPSQIEAISNGKLKPKYANDTGTSRAQNRRSDIMYMSGQPQGYSEDSNGLPMIDSNMYSGTVIEGIE